MESQDQLTLARDLVEALEAGERGSADRIVNALALGLESSVSSQVATMTEELRKALADLEGDVGVAGMTLHEIPDVRDRLHYIIAKTERAAHRTISSVEAWVLRLTGGLRRVKVLCLLCVVATTGQLAFAQTENRSLEGQQVQLPNDVEQKASYCLAVLKLQDSEAAALDSKLTHNLTHATNPDTRKALEAAALRFKKHVDKLNDNINRIESFLLPRLPYLEPAVVLTAYYRGEADNRRQREESQVTKCIDRCKNTGFSERCMGECMEADELNRRIFQCRDLSFLPY